MVTVERLVDWRLVVPTPPQVSYDLTSNEARRCEKLMPQRPSCGGPTSYVGYNILGMWQGNRRHKLHKEFLLGTSLESARSTRWIWKKHCVNPVSAKTNKKKTNSMVWVRERTIPTERPPLVGEVIANFCGWRVPRGQRDGSLRPYSRFSRQEPLLFYQVAPQLYSRGWVGPVPDPLLFFCSAGNRTRAPGSVAKNSEH
jgi:hypothetical protein